MPTTRETIADMLAESTDLRNAGLSASQHSDDYNAVYQADTSDSPQEEFFLVLRWGKARAGMGRSNFNPLTIWCYGPIGNYTKLDRIASAAVAVLTGNDPIEKEGGWITQIRDLQRGPDARDNGYQKAVVPYDLEVVASGI